MSESISNYVIQGINCSNLNEKIQDFSNKIKHCKGDISSKIDDSFTIEFHDNEDYKLFRNLVKLNYDYNSIRR